jgi:hypothetical protein
MYQANQQALNQTTNISLIDIRQTEINYFANFFASFGTQCFFLTAVLAGSVSQTPSFNCAENCSYLWQYLYNISVSSCIAVTSIELLISVFVTIYAQGLAIRGKEGSMIDALHGMIAEQEKVVRCFCISVVLFQLQFIAMFFIVAEEFWGMVCAILIASFSYYTYYSSLRIYNRFKWNFDDSGWNYDRKMNEEKELFELSPELMQDIMHSPHLKDDFRGQPSQLKRVYSNSVEHGLINEQDPDEKKKTLLIGIMNGNNRNNNNNKKKQVQFRFSFRGDSSLDDNNMKKHELHNSLLSDSNDSPLRQQEQKQSKKSNPFMKGLKSFPREIISLFSKNSPNGPSVQPQSPQANDNPSHSHNYEDSDARYYEMKDLDSVKTQSSRNSSSNIPILAGGYLTVHIMTTSRTSASSPIPVYSQDRYEWKRYYFILRESPALLFYYENEKAFYKDPTKPVNSRPIDLHGYVLSPGTAESPFGFALQPFSSTDIRKTWKFRCDHTQSQNYWIEKLTAVLKED